MRSLDPGTTKCLFVAWVFGWVTAIYVPSFAIAVLSLSPLVKGGNLFADSFAVADEVAPAAKILFAILFASSLITPRIRGANQHWLIDAALGMASMLLVVALLPADWSRGFGIGLNGTRFELLPTAIYVCGGLLSGIVFSISEARCTSRNRDQQTSNPSNFARRGRHSPSPGHRLDPDHRRPN